MGRSVGRLVADSLVAHGADLVFCVPGESFLGLTDAMTDLPVLGLERLSLGPADFTRFLASETTRWREVVQTAGIRPE